MPLRTCLGCRKVRAKSALLRLALTPSGQLVPDIRGRLAGRGAYLCPEKECIAAACANKGAFSRAFKRRLDTPQAAELTARLLGPDGVIRTHGG